MLDDTYLLVTLEHMIKRREIGHQRGRKCPQAGNLIVYVCLQHGNLGKPNNDWRFITRIDLNRHYHITTYVDSEDGTFLTVLPWVFA